MIILQNSKPVGERVFPAGFFYLKRERDAAKQGIPFGITIHVV